MGTSGGNWADLPIEILDEMFTKVGDVEDSIRFGAVSRSWRCASLDSKKMDKTSFVPWVMLSEPEVEVEESDKEDMRKFFNLSTKKTIDLYLPEVKGRRCWGSTYGWILTIGVDLNIHLLNPLTRLQISLPPQPTFETQCVDPIEDAEEYEKEYGEPVTHYLRRTYIEKFALSTHPNQQDGSSSATVMVVCSTDRTLAVARPQDRAWTDVKCRRKWFDDVIFFNNHFYAVQHGGDVVVVCDITTPEPVATDFMPSPFPIRSSIKYYLVEMSGHLHMVVRMFKTIPRTIYVYTVYFRVYKLDFCQKQWVELQDLGDHALFLGNNDSFATHHPDLPSNCIYFTDDHSEFHLAYQMGTTCDMGLFDFGEKKVVDSLYSRDCVLSTFCTPLFFTPNLH